jgi:hypothetical protein
MSETVIVALITAGTSALVAITALLLNYRGFASIDARFASLESSVNGRFSSLEGTMNSRFASVEQRLNVMQTDLKEFYKVQAEHDRRISRLEG